jgi:AraC-like DNA-binding protein
MKFDSYLPADELKPYIKAIVISESETEQIYKVLPDTSLVIGFQYRGNLSYLNKDVEIPLSRSGITGLRDSFRIFKNSAGIGTVLVYFKETGAAHFFTQPINELFQESISLDNFMLRSELLILEEQLCEANSDNTRIAIVERFLISRMKESLKDSIVMTALSIIHKSKGTIRIKELTEQLNISQSPLEKRFRRAVGTSPKKFASIVRIKNIIQQYKKTDSLIDISYEAGFYDQSHFIKEFKTFTGNTPDNFFNKKITL